MFQFHQVGKCTITLLNNQELIVSNPYADIWKLGKFRIYFYPLHWSCLNRWDFYWLPFSQQLRVITPWIQIIRFQ